MDTSDPDLLPEGLEDRLPRGAAAATRVMRTIHGVMEGHGYDRVLPPMIEFERSLASRMAGISSRRMFRFVDPQSLRMMALRSDITPQIGRIAGTRLAAAPRPLRLCYAGQVVTIKGAGLDPAREKLQCGAELIGADNVAAAAEVVAVAIEALQAAGAKGVSVDFTLPDLVDTLAEKALPLGPGQIDAVRRELDTKDAGGLVEAGGEAYVPLLYATGDFDTAIEKLAAIDAGGALAGRIAALREIALRLDGRARLTLDPSERHGFEYQSWFGFVLYADGVRGALGRGGTYRIAAPDGGEGEVATGFSLYPDALIDLIASAEPPADKLFLPLGHDRAAADRLRAIGWRTVAALSEADEAVSLGCTHVLGSQGPQAL
ncbi:MULTISPECIES: ATP phosphoribosyltransferase regulatory subunit [unclassified Novosphingobium]|uniref:ATP phosphoribosyltransferase regulatory subunit n=1 Tax=Novosphingobium TaxID=165696 RepID=UPI00146C27F9|nr:MULTISPECIES: ATP phosphoribosyltransferase regulatory subunit [unclassified Novosphingobium]NMN06972.1 ATP phosphoribosyltransferase regulatory subunit [Novosphingobium sp. SG919]NMN89441.1 ATP phosphoribosyltransferase regulatory subunit [Novosphingobium sp. SG916]